jgi:hypothetical protein
MIAENKREKHRKEAEHKSVLANQAWDDVDYIDLEVDDDFFQKCLAIQAGEPYSTDVSVPIDLPDDLLLFAFQAAHQQNITFNEYVNRALRDLIDRVESGEITREDAQKFVLASAGKPWPFDPVKESDNE